MLVTYKKTDIGEIWRPQVETREMINTNHNQSKHWGWKSNSNQYIYKTTPTPTAQGTFQKGGGWKDFKRQRIREFAMKFHLLVMSELPRKSHQREIPNLSWQWQQQVCQSGQWKAHSGHGMPNQILWRAQVLLTAEPFLCAMARKGLMKHPLLAEELL